MVTSVTRTIWLGSTAYTLFMCLTTQTKKTNSMRLITRNGLTLLEFEKISPTWHLKHCLSTRIGGVSSGPFTTLNVGAELGDSINNVAENRKRVCEAIEAPINLVAMEQTHSANVSIIRDSDYPKWPNTAPNVDALITNIKSLTLLAVAADCSLSLFFDPKHDVLAIAHSGWRGALLNIYGSVLRTMTLEYDTNPEDVYVGIGPTISSSYYNVEETIISKLRQMYPESISTNFYTLRNGKYFLRITSILEHQLSEQRVTNVETSGICTAGSPDLLYSHRREGLTGRNGLFAFIAR
ncbi:MAG: laccase domain-containing protein [Desulfobacteraceae bacterium]|nr:MAG: laccase domain-containing protein [Desulfobacteraceae bacterium]